MEHSRQNKHKKRRQASLFFCFLGLLFIPALLGLFLPDQTFSEMENKTLSQRPPFSLKSLLANEYSKDLPAYLSDQFPLKDRLVRFKASVDKLLGRQELNDVYVASNRNLMEKFKPMDEKTLRQKAHAINSFYKKHRGLRMNLMLVPNKVAIYPNEVPKNAPEPSQSTFLKEFYSYLDPAIVKVDLMEKFKNLSNSYLFFRTDHHWTQEGAFRAQEVFFEKQGLPPRAEADYDLRKVVDHFEGSLASKSGIFPSPGDAVSLYTSKTPEDLVVSFLEEQKKQTSFYNLDALQGKDKYLVFLGGNYPVVRIGTAAIKDKRLLILKDSYANAFVPFLSKEYNEITMVDLRYFKGDIDALVKEYLITDVLFLYNINTFNTDSSILNLSQDVQEAVKQGSQTQGKGVFLKINLNEERQRIKVSLSNQTAKEIRYFKAFTLHRLDDNGNKKEIISKREVWDPNEHTLSPGTAVQYSVNLPDLFGTLEKGDYQISQTYNNQEVIQQEFSLP